MYCKLRYKNNSFQSFAKDTSYLVGSSVTNLCHFGPIGPRGHIKTTLLRLFAGCCTNQNDLGCEDCCGARARRLCGGKILEEPTYLD